MLTSTRPADAQGKSDTALQSAALKMPNPLAVDSAQAAKLLCMSESWLYKMRMLNRGPKYIRISKTRVLYRVCDLEEYLAEQLERTKNGAWETN